MSRRVRANVKFYIDTGMTSKEVLPWEIVDEFTFIPAYYGGTVSIIDTMGNVLCTAMSATEAMDHVITACMANEIVVSSAGAVSINYGEYTPTTATNTHTCVPVYVGFMSDKRACKICDRDM